MNPELHDRNRQAPGVSRTSTAPSSPSQGDAGQGDGLDGMSVQRALGRFLAVRHATEEWTRSLEPGDFVLQSMPDASPIGWHLAHTTWFLEEFVLSSFDAAYERFHPRFQFLFNSYYETVGQRVPRHQRGMLSRPGAEEIRRYRKAVSEAVVALIPRLPAAEQLRALGILEIGIQHEQQHQELMVTDLKHAFSLNPLRPSMVVRDSVPPEREAVDPTLAFHVYSAGLYRIGIQATPGWSGSSDGGFSFDNEGPEHRVHLESFELADRAVTCGEWIEFMEAGGYRDPVHWLSAGWARLRQLGDTWSAPLYWEQRSGEWWHFTASGDRKVDLLQPVTHISYYEADAYARWRGCRLPTEFEWEVAAASAQGRLGLGSSELGDPELTGRFRESLDFEPSVAPARPHGEPSGLRQLYGDVWEWTSSAYAAYPRYSPDVGALGEYNGKFMSGQFVLRGGSCATPESHIRPTYRNFFPADARWQFSGLRLARDPQI